MRFITLVACFDAKLLQLSNIIQLNCQIRPKEFAKSS
jgi:hypothetical protein